MSATSTDVDPRLAARRGPAPECTMDRAFSVLGTRSAILLLRELIYGAKRFDELTAKTGLSEPSAAARLKDLVEQGLLAREPYRDAGQRTRYAYRLTEQGSEAMPILLALMRWGDRWLTDDGGPVEMTHLGCGAPVEVQMRCTEGHAVTMQDVHVGPSPARLRAAQQPS